MNLEEIKIGMRVIINSNCIEAYWGVRGTISRIDAPIDPKDKMIVHVTFDIPYKYLTEEYFSAKELDKL